MCGYEAMQMNCIKLCPFVKWTGDVGTVADALVPYRRVSLTLCFSLS